MKDTLIILLQQRMDKCTTEQFWAVASLTTADGFVINCWSQITESVPAWMILGAITWATMYGAIFIISRHIAYYHNRRELARLLADVDIAPANLKRMPSLRSYNSLSGVVFYVSWILLGCFFCFVVN